MKNNIANRTFNFSIFCWNIGNPSAQRAGKQVEWLRKRPENVLVLTETKRSEGCLLIERYFQAFGYNVIFPKPKGNEYGVMIISKFQLELGNFSISQENLKSRAASAILHLPSNELEIIAIYTPSRDTSYEKTQKKKCFLKSLSEALKKNHTSKNRIFCGDLNILEPDHIPHYSIFKDWEYGFYSNLKNFNLFDTFRHLNPEVKEYSWVGRTGDGYRYDHCFVSINLLQFLRKCYYLHQYRDLKLSDHSALITNLEIKQSPDDHKEK